MTPHLNRLIETVQMKGHNICFYAELTKIIPNYHKILPLVWSSDMIMWVLVIQSQRHDKIIFWGNGYTFMGSSSIIFASLLNRGQRLTLLHSERPKLYGVFGHSECNRVKRKNMLLEQILSFKSRPHFEAKRNLCKCL